jgi:hypothetical protein
VTPCSGLLGCSLIIMRGGTVDFSWNRYDTIGPRFSAGGVASGYFLFPGREIRSFSPQRLDHSRPDRFTLKGTRHRDRDLSPSQPARGHETLIARLSWKPVRSFHKTDNRPRMHEARVFPSFIRGRSSSRTLCQQGLDLRQCPLQIWIILIFQKLIQAICYIP